MLRFVVASLALVFVAFGSAPKAEAAGIPIVWGMSDHFDKIATVTIPAELKSEFPPEWAAGTAEFSHHSESFTVFWIAGLSISDKGYAVHVPGANEYWEISAEDFALFKELNLIPGDAADTGIAPMTYVMSFLGYIIIAGIVLVGVYIKSKT